MPYEVVAREGPMIAARNEQYVVTRNFSRLFQPVNVKMEPQMEHGSMQWRSQRGGAGRVPCPQPREKIRMVGNGGPITGCLIHRVTTYGGLLDACVRFSFTVLPFRQKHHH